jgi:protein farnesyltransferase subunit beta
MSVNCMKADVIRFLQACQASTGGFGGGPLQLPHLAPTYAAVASLVTIGGQQALEAVNRSAMLSFIKRMCVPPDAGGGLAVCEGAEGLWVWILAATPRLQEDPSRVCREE